MNGTVRGGANGVVERGGRQHAVAVARGTVGAAHRVHVLLAFVIVMIAHAYSFRPSRSFAMA